MQTRLMLPVVFKEFELVCILLQFFSIHYHCQLVKGQLMERLNRYFSLIARYILLVARYFLLVAGYFLLVAP